MEIDWKECALIETVPGKMSGAPVIKGTRLRPQDLLVNREQGVDWLVEKYGGITPETVRSVFAFYDQHTRAPEGMGAGDYREVDLGRPQLRRRSAPEPGVS